MALIYVGTSIRGAKFLCGSCARWCQTVRGMEAMPYRCPYLDKKKQLHDIGRRGIPFLTGAKVEGGICCATLGGGGSPELSSLPESSAGHFLSGRRWHLKNVSARS